MNTIIYDIVMIKNTFSLFLFVYESFKGTRYSVYKCVIFVSIYIYYICWLRVDKSDRQIPYNSAINLV